MIDLLICNTGDFCHAVQRNFCHPEVPRFEMQFIKHGGFQSFSSPEPPFLLVTWSEKRRAPTRQRH